MINGDYRNTLYLLLICLEIQTNTYSIVVNAKCTLFSGLHASALTAAKKLLPSSSFLIYSEKLSIIQSDDFFEENQKVGAAVTSIWV